MPARRRTARATVIRRRYGVTQHKRGASRTMAGEVAVESMLPPEIRVVQQVWGFEVARPVSIGIVTMAIDGVPSGVTETGMAVVVQADPEPQRRPVSMAPVVVPLRLDHRAVSGEEHSSSND